MSKNQHAVIAIVLSHNQKQVLLVKRRDTPMWVLPGGGIDEGEAPATAAEREVLEETGVKVSSQRLVGRYSPTNRLGRVTYVFVCAPLQGQPMATEESIKAGFFTFSSLPKPFFFLHQQWIDDALANHHLPLEKPLEGVTYWNLIKHLALHPLIFCRYLLSRLGLAWNSK